MRNVFIAFFIIISLQTQLSASEMMEEYESPDVMGKVDIPAPEPREVETDIETDIETEVEAEVEAEVEESDSEEVLSVPQHSGKDTEHLSSEELDVQRAEEAELIELGAGEEE